MTDSNLESDQALGNDGTANSTASQGSGDKQTSTFDEAKLLERVGVLIENKLQSQKDRRFDKIEKFQTEYQPVLDKVKGMLTPEQLATLQKDLEWDEMKRRTGLTQPAQAQQTGSPQPVTDEVSKVVSALNLDVNDAEVSQYVREHGADILGLAQIAIRKSKQPTPSPSDAPAMVGGGVAPDTAAILSASYVKQIKELRGNKQAILALQEEFKKKGFDPGTVDFRV
ncbi:MAG: hypothetical protein WC714_28940 [Candidatus Obscuribacterales bacterium]|jgi:hypothetical protein